MLNYYKLKEMIYSTFYTENAFIFFEKQKQTPNEKQPPKKPSLSSAYWNTIDSSRFNQHTFPSLDLPVLPELLTYQILCYTISFW